MSFRFKCPKCDQTIEAGEENIGEKFECPCGARMRIPNPKPRPKPVAKPVAAAPKPKKLKPVKKAPPINPIVPNPATPNPVAPVPTVPVPTVPVPTAQPAADALTGMLPTAAGVNPLQVPAAPITPVTAVPAGLPPIRPVTATPAHAPAANKPTGPFDFTNADNHESGQSSKSGSKRERSEKGKGRGRKKKQSNVGWIMVGISAVLVIGAVGFFFYTKNAREKKALANSNATADPATASVAPVAAATSSRSPDEEKQIDSESNKTAIAPAAIEPMANTQAQPMINSVASGTDQPINDSLDDPLNEPMANDTAQPMDALPSGSPEPIAAGFAGLVQKYASDPWNDGLHKQVLAKPFADAWSETKGQSDLLKAKYLLLRVRYFLGDKESTAPLQSIPYSVLVSAATETFWESQYGGSDLEFRAAENVENNDFHNALHIVGTESDAPATHIAIVRQQTALFASTNDQPTFFVVNRGRHIYGAKLKRMDNREQIARVPGSAKLPTVEMTEETIAEWNANNFRFPVWALENAADDIQEHFGMQPPKTKSWAIETFDINGKITRNKQQDAQSRVLN